ncbi:flagellar hook-length control protein FliK [Maritimibacter sp. DP1N21-5]|uniref:flagellar hook-length control protein FliK n=1 Tax=Maritimibacter sp. DP1N21-5 TaxID=2836867 RepID=UPI001C465DE0|nr:flagellar hook-length control protein FliK [Maritimibacter sp. DP1N21-5]MBV7407965.1 flagellar hook-length control protein FliK [Maritimibacter sp. DP1N21-5]
MNFELGTKAAEGAMSGVAARAERTGAMTFDPTSTPTMQVARQITEQLAEVVKGGTEGSLEVSLRPAELGRLSLAFSSDGAAMTVTLTTERPETLDLVRRNIGLLEQELRGLGYQSLNFSFGEGAPRSGQESSGSGEPWKKNEPAPTNDIPDAARPVGLPRSTGALDLRL